MRTVGPFSAAAEAGLVRVLLADEERSDSIAAAVLTIEEARLAMQILMRCIHDASGQLADQPSLEAPVSAGTQR